MIMKLSKPRRWKPVFEQIRRAESIVVNFSSKNIGYLAGYRYVCKNKAFESVMHSRDHPNLCDARSPIGKMSFQKFAKIQRCVALKIHQCRIYRNLNEKGKALSDLMETTWKLHNAPVVAN